MEPIKQTRVIIRRLAPGTDLLAELNRIAVEEGVQLGALSGIGALKRASVGIFLPDKKEYKVNEFDEELEICALTGNVSLKDGAPFVHAHLSLSDKEGHAIGGHIFPGCVVFVAEVVIWVFDGPRRERAPREECGGLALWAVENQGEG